jgi:hypothetical protein
MHVFISYKREEVEFAKRLYGLIQACNFTPWLDVMNLQPGEDWDSAIHQGLKNAEIVVGVLTQESLASNNVLDEWGYALSTGKRLFLLWLREVDEADIPPRYIRIQRLDLRHDEAAGMESLRAALLSAAKIVPPIPVAAEVHTSEGNSALPPLIAATLATAATTLSATTSIKTESAPILNEHETLALQSQQKMNRNRMLEKIKVFWVHGVLEQSVHGVALLELGIEPRANVVENPWDTVLQHTMYGDYRLPTGTNISDIYHDLNGEMLILGDPGSGKTTTLLELTRARIALAEQDETEPIPVVLNLSSWADERKPLVKWLVNELNTKYAVPRKVAAAWIETDALLLLLDGLDEVLLRYRDQCVQAINDFRSEHGFTRMVVCSRSADYESLSTHLHLNGAIVLQSLNDEQIDRYLAALGSEMQGIRNAMFGDAGLRKLAESPLMLSIMTLAFRGLRAADLPHLDSVEAQRRHLFETYTQRMFERRVNQGFTNEQTLHYLKWLAGRMAERKQSVFYIENLQIDWIAGDRARRLYRVIGRTSFGALMGLAVGIVAGIAFLLLALISRTSIYSSPRNIVAVALLFLTTPAAIGGLILGIAGIQAYAIDSIPSSFHPLRHFVRHFMDVILVGLVFTIVATFLAVAALLLDMVLLQASALDSETYLRLFSLAGIAGILVSAVAAFVASAINNFQSQPGRARNVICIAMLALSISLTASLLWVLLGLLGILSTATGELPHQLIAINLAALITAALVGLIVGWMPGNFKVLPYLLLSGGVVVYFIFVGIVDYSLRGGYNLASFSWVSVISLLAIFLVVGLIVGRIDDRIESAEALRWRWSWRWSLLGVIGMLILGAIINNTAVYNVTSYSPEREQNIKQQEIQPRESAIQTIQHSIDLLQPQWNLRIAKIDSFLGILPLIDDEIALKWELFPFIDVSSFELLKPDVCPVSEDYSRFYMPSFIQASGNSAVSPSEQLADLEKRLAANGLNADQVKDLAITRFTLRYCQDMKQKIQKDIDFYRSTYTVSGIQESFASALRGTLVLGISLIVIGGVAGGLRKSETVDVRTRPNSGIQRTFFSALRVMVAFSFIGSLVGALTGLLLNSLPAGDILLSDSVRSVLVPFCVLVGLAGGLAVGLIMGGSEAVIKHVVLRLFLERSGSIPRNYAALLDAAAKRILLRKVGGGYIFIHRYLLEYYASLEGQPDNPSSVA